MNCSYFYQKHVLVLSFTFELLIDLVSVFPPEAFALILMNKKKSKSNDITTSTAH